MAEVVNEIKLSPNDVKAIEKLNLPEHDNICEMCNYRLLMIYYPTELVCIEKSFSGENINTLKVGVVRKRDGQYNSVDMSVTPSFIFTYFSNSNVCKCQTTLKSYSEFDLQVIGNIYSKRIGDILCLLSGNDFWEVKEKTIKSKQNSYQKKQNGKKMKSNVVKHFKTFTIKNIEDLSRSVGKKKRVVTCELWGVKGHYRTYKNGKTVYIRPFCKGKNRTKNTIIKTEHKILPSGEGAE